MKNLGRSYAKLMKNIRWHCRYEGRSKSS